MISRINEDFLETYRQLPKEIRELARQNYKLFKVNSRHPSLHFKKLKSTQIYSVRIGSSYRALGVMEAETIIWFWIGSHAEYDKLIAQL